MNRVPPTIPGDTGATASGTTLVDMCVVAANRRTIAMQTYRVTVRDRNGIRYIDYREGQDTKVFPASWRAACMAAWLTDMARRRGELVEVTCGPV